MRVIKTRQDFVVLRRAGALPAAFLNQIEDYFNQLRVELEDEAENEFRLGRHGYIVVLEAGDNVHDLGNVGLNRENDYLMTFFTQAGAHDEEVEQWLKDQAERS